MTRSTPEGIPRAAAPPSAPSSGLGAAPLPVRRTGRSFRLFFFFSLAVALTGASGWLFADLLWRNGWNRWSWMLLLLFGVLFFLIAVGCLNAVFGYFVRRFGETGCVTAMRPGWREQSLEGTATALVVPVYNENVARVCEGVRAMYLALRETGQLGRFDFFILSDSSDPDRWIEEERRWSQLVRELGALGRVYYRRRTENTEKKSGNIRDFLNAWGARYRYFIVLDADSIMSGTTIVDLVRLMEANPSVGLIQTVPALVNAQSAFGRLQQFGSRLYGPLFVAGLNYWVQEGGNYWGHNAIIRTEPFMHHCDLPHLPGRKPFGGHILSHDFVEAALLRKGDWEVWMAWELDGSYEEGPQGIIECAKRDRRWCQGNLQHGLLLFARGLRGISRIHLLNGILGYLASPLWCLFLIAATGSLWSFKATGLSRIEAPRGLTPYLGSMTGTQHAALVFVLSLVVLFLPKVLALIDLASDPKRRAGFGGMRRAATGVLLETLASTLQAPVLMLFHTRFVIAILLGRAVHWATQKRDADGTSWAEAAATHAGQTVIGIAWGGVAWHINPVFFWWFSPVLAGMALSIPLSVLLSRRSWGRRLRELGLLAVPEEIRPPSEIASLRERLDALAARGADLPGQPGSGLLAAVLDPYANAVHVSLLREKLLNPDYAAELAAFLPPGEELERLRERLLLEGPESLSERERIVVLSDPDTMSWLHRQAWLRPMADLAASWRNSVGLLASSKGLLAQHGG